MNNHPYAPPSRKRPVGTIVLGGTAAVLLGVLLGLGAAGFGSDSPAVADTQAAPSSPESTDPVPASEPTPEPEPEPTREPFTGDLTYDETTLMLDLVWAEMSPTEREDICFAYTFLGPDVSYREMQGGFGDEATVNEDAFHDYFETEC